VSSLPQLESMQRALALSQRMCEAAEHDDWAQVARLDRERAAQLQQEHVLDARCKPLLEAMLKHNHAVLTRARAARDMLAREMGRQGERRQAVGSYLSVARESLLR
jgi:hypothetical protein